MLLKSHDLNKSDIKSQNNIYYDENKQYFNTTIKKKRKIKNSNIIDTNLLINALKDFSVKYELNNQKIMKAQKFVITFDELISLIRFTLESQRQLNNRPVVQQINITLEQKLKLIENEKNQKQKEELLYKIANTKEKINDLINIKNE